MSDPILANCRILVVEDEYMLATELRSNLTDFGAVVLGPVGNVDAALELLEGEASLDGAVLDANLQGVMVFPVADRLEERGVPYLFTTGYDASTIPARFKHVPLVEKPTNMPKLCRSISRLIEERRI